MNCYLHIGTGKTGTTTIQKFLALNRQALLDHGYLVPKVPGRTRHLQLFLYALNDRRLVNRHSSKRQRITDPVEFRTSFQRSFVSEIKQTTARYVVLTDEALAGLLPQEIERLGDLLKPLFTRIHVINYLRRQDEHVVSRYIQTLADGNSKSIEQHLQAERSRSYDYNKKLVLWAERLQPASLRARLFQAHEFANGSLVSDFLNAIDLSEDGQFRDVPRQNPSLDASSVGLILSLNRLFPQRNRFVDAARRRLVRYLSGRSSGEKMVLSVPVAEAFMAKWAESNAAVAREFFGRADGVLFRSSGQQEDDRSGN